VKAASVALSSFLWLAAASRSAPCAIVVERVDAGGSCAAAAVAVGDTLLAWVRTSGPALDDRPASALDSLLRNPHAARAVQVLESPRGVVRLTLQRGGRRVAAQLPAGDWGLRTRPLLSVTDLGTYRTAVAAAESGKADEAATGRATPHRPAEAEAMRAEAARGVGELGNATLDPHEAAAVYRSPFHWAAFQLIGDWK
jgi:hypothetical protein